MKPELAADTSKSGGLSGRLHKGLEQKRATDSYRRRRVLSSAQQVSIAADNKSCLSFCSNDYLGLANHPKVVAAFQRAASQYGVGSGASHLVSGHSREHHLLEEALAEFSGRERALLFSSGYMANMGVIKALLKRGDTVLQDKLNHASLIDAGLASDAQCLRYRHNDITHLGERLESCSNGEKLIVVDGVFSMDGDLAALPSIVKLAQQHNAWVMVDDAHGLGCLGAHGQGTLDHFNVGQQEVPILMGTLGKAFGTFGAFVAGSEELIEWLIQGARTYIYTTALPPAIAAATRVSLELLQTETWRREHLQQLIQRFRRGAENLGLQLGPSSTPIQPLIVGSNQQALDLAEGLWQRGLLVTAIRPPTVAENTARLRITFCAEHTEQQVDTLLNALEQVL